MPKFFGLDIGNHSIKAIRVDNPKSERPTLVGYAYGKTPSGILSVEDDESRRRLSESIRDIIRNSNLSGIKQVAFAIPESHVSKRFMTLPYSSEEGLETAVTFEMSKWITFPLSDARVNKIVVGERLQDGSRVVDVLGIAVRVSYLDRYIEVLEMAGLEPIAAETDGVSSVRAYSKYLKTVDQAYAILDFGSSSTDVSLGFGDRLVYSDSIPIGSDNITRAIAQTFNMDYARAEEYKKTYGVDTANFDGRLSNVITPVLDVILGDVKKLIEFFKREMGQISPSRVLVSGETANMPGLAGYLSEKLDLTVEVPNLLLMLNGSENDMSSLRKNFSGYTIALGLAMKTDF